VSGSYLLGVDLGTGGTKAILFDDKGTIIAECSEDYPLYQPQNGWAEQDADDWIRAGFNTIRSVLQKSGINAGDIAGIGISGQMHGLVMLDGEGKVIRRSLIWCDQRTVKECEEITSRVGAKRLVDITANPALTGFTASKILWVRNNEPEVYKACRHILLPKDYLRYRLTGEFATEVSDASGMQLLDIPQRRWSEEVLKALDIDINLLAKVYESPEVSGYISAEAASITGLKAGTPVVGGAGDNAAAAVGTGVVSDGKAFVTIGTSGVLFAHSDNIMIDPKGRVHTFCCAVPGAWHVMGVTQAAGLSYKWAKTNLYTGKSNKELDRLAEAVPLGANRLLFLPYLMGERTPHLDADCRGAFIGLSAMHGRDDMLRAVMEGVMYSQRDSLEILKEMNIPVTEVYNCGGGAKSPFWRQMLCDVFALPVKTVKCTEGPALGAAILAAVGTGLYPTVAEGCKAMVNDDIYHKPDMANHEKYGKYYSLYTELYPRLKDSYIRLAKL
jgi:xylulokinase